MPIYEYRCEKGHTFEVMQRMTDDALNACETCGAPAQRVFHPVAVHFKGSGFYNTDYGKKQRGGATAEKEPASSPAESNSSGAKKPDAKKPDAKKSG
ncbi:MAG: FmdB family zinc ribbon protein [Thermoleophilaceae bacterium]